MQYFLKYVMLICLSIVASCSDWKLRYLGYTNTIQIDDPKIDYSYAHKATTADITPDQVAFGTRCLSLEKVDSQNQQLCGSTIVRNVTSITMK